LVLIFELQMNPQIVLQKIIQCLLIKLSDTLKVSDSLTKRH